MPVHRVLPFPLCEPRRHVCAGYAAESRPGIGSISTNAVRIASDSNAQSPLLRHSPATSARRIGSLSKEKPRRGRIRRGSENEHGRRDPRAVSRGRATHLNGSPRSSLSTERSRGHRRGFYGLDPWFLIAAALADGTELLLQLRSERHVAWVGRTEQKLSGAVFGSGVQLLLLSDEYYCALVEDRPHRMLERTGLRQGSLGHPKVE